MKEWTIIWTPDKKERAIQIITEYMEEHGGAGELVLQDDTVYIEWPNILARIADEVLIENEGLFYNDPYKNE